MVQTKEQKKEYMRNYMREYQQRKKLKIKAKENEVSEISESLPQKMESYDLPPAPEETLSSIPDEVDDSMMGEVQPQEITKIKTKTPFIPANDAQGTFAIITPNYQDLPQKTLNTKFGVFLENFQSGHRLANLTNAEASLNNYDFVTAGEANDMNLPNVASSFFADITARCEISQGRKGFRTKYLNYLRQDVSDTRKKKGIMGNRKDEDD